MRFSIILLLLMSLNVSATDDCKEDSMTGLNTVIEVAQAAQEQLCPNKRKLRSMCIMVGSRTPDRTDPNKYAYQTAFLEAGCVKAGDSEEVRNEKIRQAWATYEDDLKCDNTMFDVRNGHLLKYAVSEYFDDFIKDVAKWKVNLNKIDTSDNRTVLDYIQYKIEKNRGNAIEPRLKSYYDRLRNAGARHRSEL